jgi:hypothetical protein
MLPLPVRLVWLFKCSMWAVPLQMTPGRAEPSACIYKCTAVMASDLGRWQQRAGTAPILGRSVVSGALLVCKLLSVVWAALPCVCIRLVLSSALSISAVLSAAEPVWVRVYYPLRACAECPLVRVI